MAKTSGDLSTYSLARLLLFAARKDFGGALRFETDPEVRVYFWHGKPAYVDFVHRDDVLGVLSIQAGFADPDTVRRALELQKTRPDELLGHLLVQLGVARDNILALLPVQQRRKLTRLFQLTRGGFEFVTDTMPPAVAADASAMAVEPFELVWKVLGTLYDRTRLEQELAPLRAGPLVLSRLPDLPASLSQPQVEALEALRRGQATLEELTSGGQPKAVLQLVYWLWAAGALDLRPTIKRTRPRDDRFQSAERLTAAFQSVPRPSSGGRSRSTLRQVRPASPPRSGVREAQDAARAHSDGKGRVTGRQRPVGQPPMTAARGDAPTGRPQAPKWPYPPLPGDALEEAKQLYEEIRSRYLASFDQNLFEILGVPVSATKQQVKDAYLALAKRFHPDRVANLGVEELREPADALFQRISEAYMTLLDDEQREEYRRILQDDSLGGSRERARMVMQAEVDFQKGEVFLRKGDLDQAEVYFSRALEENPDEGEHLAMVAWVRYLKAKRRKEEAAVLEDVHKSLSEAVQLSPKCARIYYFLGKIEQAKGDTDSALAHFERAVALNKHYLEPAREINIIRLRRAKQAKASKSSIWDRFRKH